VWRKNDGTQEGYDMWRANFGATGATGSASAAVPEPSTLLLLASISAVMLLNFRCHCVPKLYGPSSIKL
jgi:hypothetical protein